MEDVEKTAKRRGPAPKPKGEKAEQLTIRLTPKLKLGLDLLQRAQRGRSLSQVVEWAIQRGLNSVSLTSGANLGDVLDTLWEQQTEWTRLWWLFSEAPELLDFAEKAIAETVQFSQEASYFLDEESAMYSEVESGRERDELTGRAEDALTSIIEQNWDRLKRLVAERDIQGKSTEGVSLADLLGIKHPLFNLEMLEKYASGDRQWPPSES
ncbi:hypothetical protein [Tahibacter caeni]|uniref:hypothetical protein n=1 Tax=Tahibacter caeni TaxID=1453545 RepID=UPI002148ABD4|nr:hypothetical protein [Tahibacter caeni]